MENVMNQEPPKREEQVLVLAAGGMTDKEIAVRLGISPDTVGTYWRRILAKYQAASRTEVVAKYTQSRAKAAVDHLRYVNECLKLVADHMIEQATSKSPDEGPVLANAILASAPDWLLLVESDGKVIFSNRPLGDGLGFQQLFQPSEERTAEDILSQAAAESLRIELLASTAIPTPLQGHYDAVLAPCLGEPVGRVVISARPKLS